MPSSLPATEVASLGLDHIYVELFIRRLGESFELRADLVQYDAFSGRYLRDEIGREVAADADDAIEAACDLEWKADRALKVMDIDGGYKSPCAFGEAVERLFGAGYGSPYTVAAE